MKIAYVITRADAVGGASVHVRDLARAMLGRGHQVMVYIGRRGSGDRATARRRGAVSGAALLKAADPAGSRSARHAGAGGGDARVPAGRRVAAHRQGGLDRPRCRLAPRHAGDLHAAWLVARGPVRAAGGSGLSLGGESSGTLGAEPSSASASTRRTWRCASGWPARSICTSSTTGYTTFRPSCAPSPGPVLSASCRWRAWMPPRTTARCSARWLRFRPQAGNWTWSATARWQTA